MSLVREKVKAIICLGIDNKKIIDAFGNVVDMMVEVDNMSDAVITAKHLAEKGDTVYYLQHAQVSIYFKTTKTEEINLKRR